MTEDVMCFGAQRQLVGILHAPARPRPELPTVVMLNAGILHRVGPNRLYVTVARELAELGFTVLRFDVWGIGDSQDKQIDADSEHTFIDDTIAAFDALAARTGAARFLVMGICMGARIGLEVAGRDPRVAELVLMEGIYIKSLRYHASRLLSPAKWGRVVSGKSHLMNQLAGKARKLLGAKAKAAPRPTPGRPTLRLFPDEHPNDTAGKLRALLRRGVQIQLVFRDGNEIAHNYRLRRDGDAITGVGLPAGLEVAFIRFADHTFTPLISQQLLRATLRSWIERHHGLASAVA